MGLKIAERTEEQTRETATIFANGGKLLATRMQLEMRLTLTPALLPQGKGEAFASLSIVAGP